MQCVEGWLQGVFCCVLQSVVRSSGDWSLPAANKSNDWSSSCSDVKGLENVLFSGDCRSLSTIALLDILILESSGFGCVLTSGKSVVIGGRALERNGKGGGEGLRGCVLDISL